MIPLILLGCIDYDVNLDEKDKGAGFDSGDPVGVDTSTDTTGGEELCNGDDDDGDGEIDEGFPDADGNGRVDCLDEACAPLDLGASGVFPIDPECATLPYTVTDPWNVRIEWQYAMEPGEGVTIRPAVANLTDDNGDGVIDGGDIPEIIVTEVLGNELFVFSGDTGEVLLRRSGFHIYGAAVSVADLDVDGVPEIVTITEDMRVTAFHVDGSELWSTDVLTTVNIWPELAIADLDADGDVEVIADFTVLDGPTGDLVTLLEGGAPTIHTVPVTADLDRDGRQEIIHANDVYDADGQWLWGSPIGGIATFAAVMDIDGDPGGETFFVTGEESYIYDDDGTLLHTLFVPSSTEFPGAPCAGDFDGDGAPEFAFPSYETLTVLDVDGVVEWTAPMIDHSGAMGISAWDLDADGALELLVADELSFRILDGRTGATLFEDPDHSSQSLWEYPVVADVDGDGHGEIVIADNEVYYEGRSGITVYGHGGEGWPAAGPTWSTHGYSMTNIGDDGEVPTDPEPGWATEHVFRARPASDRVPRPDLVVSITDVCVQDCDWGPVKLGVQVHNQGSADAEPTQLAIYAEDGAPRLVATVAVPAVPAGSSLDGIEVDLRPEDIGARGFRVTIDDDGAGLGSSRECDDDNNTDVYTDVFCP